MNIEELPVKRLTPTATLPTRAHPDDAGLDLYADNYPTIPSGDRALVSTGIATAVPEGHVGLVCPRSGLAHQRGVTVANSPGVLDAGYRGEVMVNLANHGNTPLQIKAGGRIAQLLIVPIATPAVVEVDDLGDTARGSAGHGSTGA